MSLMSGSEKMPQPRVTRVALLGKGRSLKETTKIYENAEKGFVQLLKE
jgi:hypothetical protein